MKLIIGNWKMNKTVKEAEVYVQQFLPLMKDVKNKEIVLCPPFTALERMSELLRGSNVKIGAQNMHYKEEGAFTGEISLKMLKEFGVEYVILGHSERRQFFQEDNSLIQRKVKAALQNNLKPILCVGENLMQRNTNRTLFFIEGQLKQCLEDIPEEKLQNLVIAYEPIWAIGTGKNATPEQAQEVHAFIRERLEKMFGEQGKEVRIIYGGSAKPENAAALLAQKDIDGLLVGGASLEPESFAEIFKS